MEQTDFQGHLHEHIGVIAKHEQEFLARRTPTERLGDRTASFIGSMPYLGLHVVLFGVWIAWNVSPARTLPRFDPAPFPLLDLVFAFEAILVASFILMRQGRMSRRSQERDHLMLQILLLSEREMTAMLGLQREIADRMGLHSAAKEEEIVQLSQQTSIDEVATIIHENLTPE